MKNKTLEEWLNMEIILIKQTTKTYMHLDMYANISPDV
jgi:hypothetical protein